jgi:hypothetical protein
MIPRSGTLCTLRPGRPTMSDVLLAGAANRAMMVCPAEQGTVEGERATRRRVRVVRTSGVPVFFPATRAMKQRTWPRIVAACSPLVLTPLAGCAGRGAPSYALFGAYFPFWLLSAVTGIVGALVAHRVFVATGWARGVPYQLSVCTAIGTVVGVFVWLCGTGQL